MVNITVGQTLNIGVAVHDFCGGQYQYIYISNIGLGVNSPATVTIDPSVDCLNISNIGIEIKLGVSSGSQECHSCAPHLLFTSLGILYTNYQGVVSLSHVISNTDLSYYQQAIADGGTLKVIACITNPQGQQVVNVGQCSDSITIVDICSGVVCPDICVGNNLYSQVCDPATGLCVQGTLIQPSPHPTCSSIGNISFDSSPQGAEIWLAQSGHTPVDKGLQTPNTISDLPAGNYDFILRRFNYQDYTSTISVLASQTTNVSATLVPILGAVYQLKMKLGSETTGTYITNTLNKFSDAFNSIILSKFSVLLSDVSYNQIDYTVTVEIEDMPILSMGHLGTTYGARLQTEYLETLHIERMETLRLEYPIFYNIRYNSNYYSNNPQVKSLILPLLVPIIIELLPYVAILLGWVIASILFGGPKIVTPSQSNLQITALIMTNGLLALPTKDVKIEIAGQKFTVTSLDNFTQVVQNLQIGTTYPIKAYIPLSVDSNVYEASFIGNKTIVDTPMNTMIANLKMDTLQQRDWQLCDLKLDGNPMPEGTIIRVFRTKMLADGTPILDTLGTTTSDSNSCSGIIKVPAYLLNSQLSVQYISNSVDPTNPSPTLHGGDQTDIPTIGGEKNTITVTTETILQNNIVADKIEIKDAGVVIKSIVPTVNTTLISGIPIGTYDIIVTKAGYKTSECSVSSCQVTFTTDYLESASITVILESLVKTCKLTITVVDKYMKSPKTQTFISIDGGAGQIALNGVIDIPEIIAGSHKFTIKADGYNDIVDLQRTIGCATAADATTFSLEQNTDIIIGSMDLLIDGQKGSVQVAKNQVFTVTVSGGNGAEPIEIYNISEVPDLLVATIPAGQGLTGTTLSYDKDMTLELQAFQGCILGVCLESSNVVSITIGTGSPKCSIPGPFGGCILEQSTGLGIMALAGVGLIAAMTIFGKEGGGTKLIERTTIPPHYTPPEIKKEMPK